MKSRFKKAAFKKDVQENVRRLFRKELDEANPQEQYQAVSYAPPNRTPPMPNPQNKNKP